MSRTYLKLINKHQKHQKDDFQEYLYATDKPKKYVSKTSLAELDEELSEDIELMRKNFRHLVYRMRSKYA